MKKTLITILGVIILIGFTGGISAQITIQNTRDCDFPEKLAAKEIRKYIFQRTDSLLSIAESDVLPVQGNVILLARDTHPLLEDLRVSLKDTCPAMGYMLKSIKDGDRIILLISGFDSQAVLYGAYRFAEHLGVGFDLAGDILPDTKIDLSIDGFDELAKPLLETRGIQPFHDFYQGPDFWSTPDYISVISQLPKLGMNFFGLHTYPTWSTTEEKLSDTRQGPEPTVWIGLEEDVEEDGKVNWSYPAFYAHTHRPHRIWGNDTLGTNFFHAGSDQLFECNGFGSDVFMGSMPADIDGSNRVFNRTGAMLNKAFSRARSLNVKTSIGTELTLGLEPKGNAVGFDWPRVMPPALQERLSAMGRDPMDPELVKEVYKGIFTRIKKTHPLDYYWLWSWEGWSMHDPVTRKQVDAFKKDIILAHEALHELGSPFQLALAGWILGTVDDPAVFDDQLPEEAPFFGLWDEADGFEELGKKRVKWPATWLEEDWGLIQPQFELHRIYKDIKAAVNKDCDGIIAKHWRTRVLGANTWAMKDLLWTHTSTGSAFVDSFPPSRKDWIDTLYLDWASHQFGPESAEKIASVFASLDNAGEPGSPGAIPHISGWDSELEDGNGSPGAILPNDAPWSDYKQHFAFVSELEDLKQEILGGGNQERFDYWLKTMQILKLMGEYGCIRYQFEDAMENSQWTDALEYRKSLARLFEQMLTLQIEKAVNVSDLGEIVNMEILNWQQLLVLKWDKKLSDALGAELPPDAHPSKVYSGKTSIKVTTRQTQINADENLVLKVIIAGKHLNPVIKWRSLGSRSYQSIPLRHVSKGVYQIEIPESKNDFEYYIQTLSGSDTIHYPASAPEINCAVIVLDENPDVLKSLKEIASTEGFKPYAGNPVLEPGPDGSFDAGALGSMSVLKVGDTFHMYYETWGLRSEAEWDAEEYESLQIGHATSKDGIHWTKDSDNPVLPRGGEADFDRTGVWDPYVIHEDGIFKMWYGGGGGSMPNFGWAYATSEDGSHFQKKGLIGIGNQTGVEDCHVVYDEESGLYFMYYWHGWSEPEGLYLVTSPSETGFDFNEAINIHIENDESYMKKFGHVLRDKNGWHMFYSNFVQPHCPNSITRYAYSRDGIHWEAKNKRLVRGHDSEVLKVTDDLYLMFSSAQNGFDRVGTDVHLSVYNGNLNDLASKAPFFELPPPSSLEGKKFDIALGEEKPITFHFKPEGEVVLSEEWNIEDPYTFNAYYIHEGQDIQIMGEGIHLTGNFNGETLILNESQNE